MAELYPASPMFYIELFFGKIPVQALLDSGASMNFIPERVASELRFRRHKLHAGQTIVAATGENIACTHFTHVYVQMGVLKFYVNLRIVPMHPDLILGIPFLVRYNPLINWQERSFRVMRYGKAYWIPIVQKPIWSEVNAIPFPNDPSPLASSKGIPFPEWEEPTEEDKKEVAKLYEHVGDPLADFNSSSTPPTKGRKKKKKGAKPEIGQPVRTPQELAPDIEALLRSFEDVFLRNYPKDYLQNVEDVIITLF